MLAETSSWGKRIVPRMDTAVDSRWLLLSPVSSLSQTPLSDVLQLALLRDRSSRSISGDDEAVGDVELVCPGTDALLTHDFRPLF
jgi:hypothetical protein